LNAFFFSSSKLHSKSSSHFICRRLKILDKATQNDKIRNTKLTAKDLVVLVDEATKMLRSRFEETILFYQQRTVEKMFDEENVTQNDWTSKEFCSEILILKRKKLNLF
jgi:hypothetical protein